VPLEVLSARKEGSHDKNVPLFLVKCLSLISMKGSELPHIYREKGDEATVQKFKALFDQVGPRHYFGRMGTGEEEGRERQRKETFLRCAHRRLLFPCPFFHYPFIHLFVALCAG
jgi:hypothetical protein